MPLPVLLMELYNESTEHTNQVSQIYLDGKKVMQKIEVYRDISNEDQLSAILENLVLNKGFVMDKAKDKCIKLTNPIESEVVYYVWLDSLGIMKETNRLVGNVM
jgi:hypothetical protein